MEMEKCFVLYGRQKLGRVRMDCLKITGFLQSPAAEWMDLRVPQLCSPKLFSSTGSLRMKIQDQNLLK